MMLAGWSFPWSTLLIPAAMTFIMFRRVSKDCGASTRALGKQRATARRPRTR